MNPDEYIVTCNGVQVPIKTDIEGEYVSTTY